MSAVDALPDARSLLDRANAAPSVLLHEADGLLELATDPLQRATVLRALGLAARNVSDVTTSLHYLDDALTEANRVGDAELIGEVQMTRSPSLSWAGRTEDALEALDAAVTVLTGPRLAQALVQRGSVYTRMSRYDEALADFASAQPILENVEDDVWQAHLLANQGVVLAYRGRVKSAEESMLKARRLYAALGHDASVAELTNNLGWAASQAGDIPRALEYFDTAEGLFKELGYPLLESLLDRCETLMAARLTTEARGLAARAADQFMEGGVEAGRAEALLLLAQAALAGGDPEASLVSARDAAKSFQRQARPGWEAYADSIAIEARSALGTLNVTDVAGLREAATRLAAIGLLEASLHARLLAGQIAIDNGDIDDARSDLELAASARHRGSIALRVQAWLALALLRLAEGQRGAADSAARAGLRVVEDYQATLGATEARAHIAAHATGLAEVGLRLAAESNNARRLFAWLERTRAGALRLPPARPPDDDALAEDLAQLRVVEGQIRAAELAGSPAAAFEQRRIELQETIRRRTRRVRGAKDRPGRSVAIGSLIDALGERGLVEFGTIDGRVVAVSLQRGRAHRHELGSMAELARALDALRFGLQRIAQRRGSEASRAAAADLVHDGRSWLDAALMAPLRLGDEELVLVPPAALHSVPWSLLPSLAGTPVSLVPAAELWMQRHGRPSRSGRTVVVNGPGLPEAAAEARVLQGLYPDAIRFTARSSRVGDVWSVMNGADLVHIASHGRFRADNPLFSSLELADGSLTVYDLERLDRAPGTIVLSACDTALPAERPGNEILGLVAGLLGIGTNVVVAGTGLVPDAKATRRLMGRFHARMISGERPAQALAAAQAETLAGGDLAAATFVCFGAG